jgi:hypothetical protein
MAETHTLTVTEEELEMIIDALEVDHEGYIEAVKEARGNNAREDVATFGGAAERIAALMNRLREMLDE